MNRLAKMRTLYDIEQYLMELDKETGDLSSVYESKMQDIERQPPDIRRLALAALMWTVWAKRPLSTTELSAVIVTTSRNQEGSHNNDSGNSLEHRQINMQILLSACGGMLCETQLTESSKGIRLVHFTASEYISRTQGRWFAGADTLLARSCITYLSLLPDSLRPCVEEEDWVLRSQQYPLLGYTARYWGVHAKLSEDEPSVGEGWLVDALQDSGSMRYRPFWTNDMSFLDAISQARRLDKIRDPHFYDLFPASTTAFHLAGYFGLTTLLERLSTKGMQRDDRGWLDSEGHTPMWYASLRGHLDALKRLLTLPHAVSSLCQESTPNTAVVAQFNGGDGIIGALHQVIGANAVTQVLPALGKTPLFLAALQEHDGIVRQILDTGQVSEEAIMADFELMKSYAAEYGSETTFSPILRYVHEKRAANKHFRD